MTRHECSSSVPVPSHVLKCAHSLHHPLPGPLVHGTCWHATTGRQQALSFTHAATALWAFPHVPPQPPVSSAAAASAVSQSHGAAPWRADAQVPWLTAPPARCAHSACAAHAASKASCGGHAAKHASLVAPNNVHAAHAAPEQQVWRPPRWWPHQLPCSSGTASLEARAGSATLLGHGAAVQSRPAAPRSVNGVHDAASTPASWASFRARASPAAADPGSRTVKEACCPNVSRGGSTP